MGSGTQVIVRKIRKLEIEWFVAELERLVCQSIHRHPPPRYWQTG